MQSGDACVFHFEKRKLSNDPEGSPVEKDSSEKSVAEASSAVEAASAVNLQRQSSNQSSIPDDLEDCTPLANGTPRAGEECSFCLASPRANTPRNATPRGNAGAFGFSIPEDELAESEAVEEGIKIAERQLPDKLRICILGGTEVNGNRTEDLVRKVAQSMHEAFNGKVAFLLGGSPRLRACFAQAMGNSDCLFNFHLNDEVSDCEAGLSIHCGSCANVRSHVLSQLAEVYISFEGDSNTAREASLAYNRGVLVLPVKYTGGASGGLHSFPAPALWMPEDCASIGQWSRLCERCDPELTASALSGIVSRRLDIITIHAMPLELKVSSGSSASVQNTLKGRYAALPGQVANRAPLYKHASQERYLYMMPNGAWGFGHADAKAEGFGMKAFAFHPARSLGASPASLAQGMWKVYNGKEHAIDESFAVRATKHGARLDGHWRAGSGAVMVVQEDLVSSGSAGAPIGTLLQAVDGCTLRKFTGDVFKATFGPSGELIWSDGELWRQTAAPHAVHPPPPLPGLEPAAAAEQSERQSPARKRQKMDE